MRARDGGFFDSYDFFGKAIPGVVWLFGIVLLLPMSIFPDGETTVFTIRNVALILITGVAVGLVFGEGIHNVAVNIERSFGWLRGWLMRLRDATSSHRPYPILFAQDVLLGKTGDPEGPPDQTGDESTVDGVADTSDETDKTETNFKPRMHDWWENTKSNWSNDLNVDWVFPIEIGHAMKDWAKRRLKEVDTGLISHRDLFVRNLEDQVLPYRNTESRKETKYELFVNAVESELDDLDVTLEREGSRLEELYPLITTRLDEAQPTRAGSFQSRYSFCRSMWVVLAGLTIAYLSVFVHQNKLALLDAVSTLPTDVANFTAESVILQLVLAFSLTLFIGVLIESLVLVFAQNWRENALSSLMTVGLYVVAAGGLVLFGGDILAQIAGLLVHLFVPVLGYSIELAAQLTDIYATLFNYKIDEPDILLFSVFGGLIGPLIIVLTVSTIAFFDASGDYKEYYVEYLVTEYTEKVHSSDGDKDPDD
ncbi:MULTISPECIES: hypothetical protein [Haloferax]|uniref:Uncharacterized protein n=2 Tax=Haloferax TaxID=2251 RepID=A0A6G1Z762_9EURY|nr:MULTISPECIES: hypothetical protein [Haloferax]KAB1184777.1 hypothetical protein Hfx1149_17080 [Haloferax sp. CBA1149]MRW82409.1 hypothetical protein [Haloferax marinisediminis]